MPLFGKPMCRSDSRLEGKTSIVTGCNSGIGKETVKEFFKRGCHVIMACRSVEKAEAARNDILRELKDTPDCGRMSIKKCDVSSLKSVRQFAEEISKEEAVVDILVNNAGIGAAPFAKSEDGFELHWVTNHLGHFLLTLLLLPQLNSSSHARVINISSRLYELGEIDLSDLLYETKPYSPVKAYCRSKLANVLFTKELAERLKGTNVHTYAVHPGLIDTDIFHHLNAASRFYAWMLKYPVKPFYLSPTQGAQTTIHCAVDEKAGRETGLYYTQCRVKRPTARARDMDLARRLWDVSLKMVNMQNPLPQDN